MKHLPRIVSFLDMLKFSAPLLATPLYNFGMMSERLVYQARVATETGHHSLLLSEGQYKAICQSVRAVMEIAEKLQLPATTGAVERSAVEIGSFQRAYGGEFSIPTDAATRLGYVLTSASTALSDELSAINFFMVQSGMEGLLDETKPPFGDIVSDTFPDAIEDIAEAAKCLALGRATASVFHLMRAMELAVRRMAEQFDVPNVEKEWGKLLSEIGKRIEALPKGSTRDAWSEAHSHLYHVKQAWRNSTMHPKKTYTEIEAKAVFDAVKSFMRHLAPLVPPI